MVPLAGRFLGAFLLNLVALSAQTYAAPAGIRPALKRAGSSILPGGRIVAPRGEEYPTGAGAFGLAISPSGRTAVTANTGPGRNSITVLDRDRSGHWEVRQLLAASPSTQPELDAEAGDWRGVFMGTAFSGEHAVYA